jgi:ABC-2 type transport system permease protein
MRNILRVTANTLRVTFKAKSKVLVYFICPVLGLVLSLFVNFGPSGGPARVGIVDNDGGRFSTDLVKSVGQWGGYSTAAVAAWELSERIARGSLDCGMVVPAGYSASVFQGAVLPVELVSAKGEEVTGWLGRMVDLYGSSLSDLASAAGGEGAAFERMYAALKDKDASLKVEKLPDTFGSKQITVSTIGFLIYFLILGATITMQLVLTERRNRTYFRIRSAPVRASEYIAGNGVAGLFIVVVQILSIQILLKYVFRVDTHVSDLLLFAILFVFGTVAVGLAMAITAFSSSSFMASVISNLLITPTCMIAGCFWPASVMPAFLQKLSFFLPQRWTLDAVQKAQSGGAVGTDLLVIAAFALVFFILASYRFSRVEESGQFV